jgi:hypothetical protein
MGKIILKTLREYFNTEEDLECYELKLKDFNQSLGRFKRMFKTSNLQTEFFDDCENIVDLILNKYSLFTVQQSIKVIILILTFYGEKKYIPDYQEQLIQIQDMRVNSSLYSKLSNSEIAQFIDKEFTNFVSKKVSFSKFRHFMLLAILVKEVTLKFQTLADIHYHYHSFIEDSDCVQHKSYLIRNNEKFHFIFNLKKDGIQQKQVKYEITDRKVRMLLKIYFSRYANNLHYVFTTSGGKKCSESNIANSLSNFCRLYLGVPLTLGEIRSSVNTRELTDNQKFIYENF